MDTWANWTLWLLTIATVLKILHIGIGDYPRETSRGIDSLDVIITLAFIIWGFAVK